MNSRCSDLVDHDPRNAGCSSSRRFLFPRLRGCRAWQGSRTRGRLTRPYRLTSASDLTRNSISFPGSSLLHFYFRIFPSRAAGDRERDVADHLGISGVTHFLVHKLANSIAQYFPFERFLSFIYVYISNLSLSLPGNSFCYKIDYHTILDIKKESIIIINSQT